MTAEGHGQSQEETLKILFGVVVGVMICAQASLARQQGCDGGGKLETGLASAADLVPWLSCWWPDGQEGLPAAEEMGLR